MPKFHTVLEIFRFELWPTFHFYSTVLRLIFSRLYRYGATFPLPNGVSCAPLRLIVNVVVTAKQTPIKTFSAP